MIVDEYELSPIQQGMLFHHLKDEHSGIDIEQLVIEYKEPLDVVSLERAWQATIDKHPMLRSSFRWEGLPSPVQHVHDAAGICIEQHQCADAAAFSAFIMADRRRGFDLARPPLMRLSWLRSDGSSSRLVWTLHHILMDGRAFVIVLDEVERYYRDLRRGVVPNTKPGAPYKPYVGWIRSLDLSGAAEFWREKLSGLSAPTPLPLEPDHLPKDVSSHGEIEHQLSKEVTSALRAMAKQHDITLNTVVMGVWAIVLARFSGESDVLFGATKTTRRASIANGDSVVGLFLNTLPVRIDVSDTMQVVEMLKRLRNEWVSLRPYEHAPLVQIKQASAFPGAAQLFDSLVVFENQRFDTALASCGPEWCERELRWFEQTNYGLTLLAYGDPAMTLKLEFDVRRFSRATAQRILAHVVQAFASVAQNPYDTLANA
ncbi:MAG TPA: condensation domain-containing protein [Gemmatimonadaceae bacterium]|nr:condensation domain-containing protein [Gemmatimonadaceae bacterium]